MRGGDEEMCGEEMKDTFRGGARPVNVAKAVSFSEGKYHTSRGNC
jgi:hypothetical protein